METIILCGGEGTRLRTLTQDIPKPLVPINGKPIVVHIMDHYASFGFMDFTLCLGYKGHLIEEYFKDNPMFVPIAYQNGTLKGANEYQVGNQKWRIRFVDTGEKTGTGGRIKRVGKYISGDSFFVTYSDGLSNIQLDASLKFHQEHDKIATVTVVRPYCQFGVLSIDNENAVVDFREKPKLNMWINGGFFVFKKKVLDDLDEYSMLEEAPLRALASRKELLAFHHDGFWKCMDTYKDYVEMNEVWPVKK